MEEILGLCSGVGQPLVEVRKRRYCAQCWATTNLPHLPNRKAIRDAGRMNIDDVKRVLNRGGTFTVVSEETERHATFRVQKNGMISSEGLLLGQIMPGKSTDFIEAVDNIKTRAFLHVMASVMTDMEPAGIQLYRGSYVENRDRMTIESTRFDGEINGVSDDARGEYSYIVNDEHDVRYRQRYDRQELPNEIRTTPRFTSYESNQICPYCDQEITGSRHYHDGSYYHRTCHKQVYGP